MGHNKRRPSLHQPVQFLLDQGLAFRIKGSGGFIQNQNGSILQESAGNRYTLPLASGQSASSVAKHGLVAVRHAHDKAVRSCGARRSHHHIIRSVLPSQPDVFHNGAVEQDGVLGNEGDIFAHIVQGSVPHIHAIHAQGSGTNVIKPGEKAGKCCFSGSAGPYQPHYFPGADMHVYAVQHLAGTVIGEGNAVIVQTAGGASHRNGVSGLRHGIRFFQEVIDAFQGSVSALQIGKRHTQPFERVVTHEQGGGQSSKISLGDAHFMPPYQQNAQTQRRHHFQHGNQEVPVLHRSEIDFEKTLNQPQEKIYLLFLHSVGTDFTLGGQIFLGGGRNIAQFVLSLFGLLHHAAAEKADGPYGQRNQPQIHQDHCRIRINKYLVHQEGKGGQQSQGLLDDVIGRYHQPPLHVGGVIN